MPLLLKRPLRALWRGHQDVPLICLSLVLGALPVSDPEVCAVLRRNAEAAPPCRGGRRRRKGPLARADSAVAVILLDSCHLLLKCLVMSCTLLKKVKRHLSTFWDVEEPHQHLGPSAFPIPF